MNPTTTTRKSVGNHDSSSDDRLEGVFADSQHELMGTLFYLLGNRDDAKDALQEAFLRCWRHRDGLGDIVNLRAWVFRIALNVGRDMRNAAWKRRRRAWNPDENLGEAMSSDENGRPDAEAARNEELALVRRALAELRTEEQEVFLLRQNGQMTYDQIARSLDIPSGTAKTRMRLALGKLREALAGKSE